MSDYEEVVRYLPHSFEQYKVSECGRVFKAGGEEVKLVESENGPTVEIVWLGQRSEYPLALLVLVTFAEIHLPVKFYDRIEPLHIDGDVKNCNYSNLRYRFTAPIEVEGIPGFYYVPFFTRYAISRDGELLSLLKTRPAIKSWARLPQMHHNNRRGGYLYSRVVPEGGFSSSIYKHRALCLVFKPYGANVDSLVINHLDGDSGNNDLDNIVWSTHTENALHAVANGLRPNSTKAVLVKDLKTGEITKYNSLKECAKDRGFTNRNSLSWRVNKGTELLFPDYLQYKFDDGSPWPEVDMDESNMYRNGRMDSIAAWNIFTNSIVIFQGIVAGEKATGVSATGIISQLAKAERTPVHGWVFRYAVGDADWPKYSEWHYKLYRKHPKHPPKGIVVTDVDTKEEHFFCDRHEAGGFLGLEESTVLMYARKEKTYKGKYHVRYYPPSL